MFAHLVTLLVILGCAVERHSEVLTDNFFVRLGLLASRKHSLSQSSSSYSVLTQVAKKGVMTTPFCKLLHVHEALLNSHFEGDLG